MATLQFGHSFLCNGAGALQYFSSALTKTEQKKTNNNLWCITRRLVPITRKQVPETRDKNQQPHLGSTSAEWFTLDNPLRHIVYKCLQTNHYHDSESHSHKAGFTPSESESENFLWSLSLIFWSFCLSVFRLVPISPKGLSTSSERECNSENFL